jgi:hypothetical protein
LDELLTPGIRTVGLGPRIARAKEAFCVVRADDDEVRVTAARDPRSTRDGLASSLSVARTGNTLRVRDGYISESTRGHARALPTH